MRFQTIGSKIHIIFGWKTQHFFFVGQSFGPCQSMPVHAIHHSVNSWKIYTKKLEPKRRKVEKCCSFLLGNGYNVYTSSFFISFIVRSSEYIQSDAMIYTIIRSQTRISILLELNFYKLHSLMSHIYLIRNKKRKKKN